VLFYLALTFGLEKDPLGSLQRMAGCVETIARQQDINESLWMTLGLSDGKTIYAVRYASDGQAPTLYHSKAIEDLVQFFPDLRERLGSNARVIVSEPIGRIPDAWIALPEASALRLRNGEIEVSAFRPVNPT
jgi:glutamine amidotransferase